MNIDVNKLKQIQILNNDGEFHFNINVNSNLELELINNGNILKGTIKEKPILFHTEDFKDGSFPIKNCNNCVTIPSSMVTCILCKHNSYKNLIGKEDNWQGKLYGEPIYKYDKTWRINKIVSDYSLDACRNSWDGNDLIATNDKTLKYFSNKINARNYHNKLAKDKFSNYKNSSKECLKVKIKYEDTKELSALELSILNKCIEIKITNKKERNELELEIGKWYKHKEAELYSCYSGDNDYSYGFYPNIWSSSIRMRQFAKWELADMNKIEKLLIDEAKKRFPIGTKFIPTHIINLLHNYCEITSNKFKVVNNSLYALLYNKDKDKLEYKTFNFKFDNTSHSKIIYCKGKWAEIIDSDK